MKGRRRRHALLRKDSEHGRSGETYGETETEMADTHAKHHDYHLVNPSPWPLTASISAFITAVGAIVWMRLHAGAGCSASRGRGCSLSASLALIATAYMWWRDVIREAHEGDHTPVVQLHLRYGMILFIASEVMFFVAWFWAYFDIALFPGACTTDEHHRPRQSSVTARHGRAQRADRRPLAAERRVRAGLLPAARSIPGVCRSSTR